VAGKCDDCVKLPEAESRIREDIRGIIKSELEQPSKDIRECRDFVVAATERLRVGNDNFDELFKRTQGINDWCHTHDGEHKGLKSAAQKSGAFVSLLISILTLCIGVVTVYAMIN